MDQSRCEALGPVHGVEQGAGAVEVDAMALSACFAKVLRVTRKPLSSSSRLGSGLYGLQGPQSLSRRMNDTAGGISAIGTILRALLLDPTICGSLRPAQEIAIAQGLSGFARRPEWLCQGLAHAIGGFMVVRADERHEFA